MADLLYQKFMTRWEEVIDLPPQRLGPLTPIYKMLVKRLKVMPWPVFLVGSVIVVFALYIFIGSAVTFLVTLLQRGF